MVDTVLVGRKNLIDELTSGQLKLAYNRKIYISDEVADEIRDLCSEMLQSVGFRNDYELTSEGKLLNELVDIFYLGS